MAARERHHGRGYSARTAPPLTHARAQPAAAQHATTSRRPPAHPHPPPDRPARAQRVECDRIRDRMPRQPGLALTCAGSCVHRTPRAAAMRRGCAACAPGCTGACRAAVRLRPRQATALQVRCICAAACCNAAQTSCASGCTALAEALGRSTSVSELSVAANDIGDAGAHALAAALATSMLTVIRLSSLSGRARASHSAAGAAASCRVSPEYR